MLYKALDPTLFSKPTHKPIITVRLLATQMEITVRRDKLYLGFQQQVHQHHGINAAAEGQNDFFALGNQVIPINICLKLLEHAYFFFFTEKPKPPIFSPRP